MPEGDPPIGGDGYDALVDEWLLSKKAGGVPTSQEPSGDEYDSIVDEWAGGQKARDRSAIDLSLNLAAGMDQARASEALRLSQLSGLPPETLYRSLTPKVKAKIEDNANRAKFDRLATDAPTTAKWSQNPLRMASDKRDLDNIAAIEKLLRARSRPGVMSDTEIEAAAEATARKAGRERWKCAGENPTAPNA